MLDLETDYAILSAHSKMAAATPPVRLLAVWSPCTIVPSTSCTGLVPSPTSAKMALAHFAAFLGLADSALPGFWLANQIAQKYYTTIIYEHRHHWRLGAEWRNV